MKTLKTDQMIVTKQMVRDLIVFKGPISVSTLAYTIFKDEVVSMANFNRIMALVLDLEIDGVVRYNAELGCYETDMVLN
jgi:hypothetical protein